MRDPCCRATAFFANMADSNLRCWVWVRSVQAEGVYTEVEASTTLNRAVDRSIEGSRPAANKVVAAFLRVLVVQGIFECLI